VAQLFSLGRRGYGEPKEPAANCQAKESIHFDDLCPSEFGCGLHAYPVSYLYSVFGFYKIRACGSDYSVGILDYLSVLYHHDCVADGSNQDKG
jgi:hypothetical protein